MCSWDILPYLYEFENFIFFFSVTWCYQLQPALCHCNSHATAKETMYLFRCWMYYYLLARVLPGIYVNSTLNSTTKCAKLKLICTVLKLFPVFLFPWVYGHWKKYLLDWHKICKYSNIHSYDVTDTTKVKEKIIAAVELMFIKSLREEFVIGTFTPGWSIHFCSTSKLTPLKSPHSGIGKSPNVSLLWSYAHSTYIYIGAIGATFSV